MKYAYKDNENKMKMIETENIEDIIKIMENMWKPIKEQCIRNSKKGNRYGLYESPMKIIQNDKGICIKFNIHYHFAKNCTSTYSFQRQFFKI